MLWAASDEGPSGGEATRAAIRPVGKEQIVFDWSSQACEPEHIPDLPVRALRDYRGQVHVTMAHPVNRSLVGPDLDRVRVDCAVTLQSARNPDPAAFDGDEWIGSLFTRDGRDVGALVHNEHHGARAAACGQNGLVPPCWYNAITLARSFDGGRSYTSPAPRLVAAPSQRYQDRAVPTGVFTPSNVVPGRDGFQYALIVSRRPDGSTGSCVIRTRNPFDPLSWRVWDGSGFRAGFPDPYRVAPGAARPCRPVSRPEIVDMHESLTYNTHLKRYLLVGLGSLPGPNGQLVHGVYFSVSRDLIHWSRRQLALEATTRPSFRCGAPNPIAYPSLIDPRSSSRTFATTGARPYLYFTRFNYRDCQQSLDRDLVRVRVEVSR